MPQQTVGTTVVDNGQNGLTARSDVVLVLEHQTIEDEDENDHRMHPLFSPRQEPYQSKHLP